MKITDEMVVAFAKGAEMGDGQGRFTSDNPAMQRALDGTKRRIINGLEAALSIPASAREVKVRELEWVEQGSTLIAETPFGGYQIDTRPYAGSSDVNLLHGDSFLSRHDSIAAAKAAAQADYEARIRSALYPSAPVTEATEEP